MKNNSEAFGFTQGDSVPDPFNLLRRRLVLQMAAWGSLAVRAPFAYAAGDEPGPGEKSVLEFGTKGNGISDDSVPLQRALDSGSSIYFPPGDYRVDSKSGLLLRNGRVSLRGASGGRSRLTQGPNAQRLLTIEAPADAIRTLGSISIDSLAFKGCSDSLGFSEFCPIIFARGVESLRISACSFSAFRGDGIYLGYNPAKPSIHNTGVEIVGSEFDGANWENRNGISIIDGSNVAIRDCQFRRCSRPNMPGSIDIEPNDDPNHVINNITIERNTFHDKSGGVGHVSFVFAFSKLNALPKTLIVRGNRFLGGRGVTVIDRLADERHDLGISIQGNEFDSVDNPVDLRGPLANISVRENHIRHLSPLRLSTRKFGLLQGLDFTGNSIRSLQSRAALDISAVGSGTISANEFANYDQIVLPKSSGESLVVKGNTFG